MKKVIMFLMALMTAFHTSSIKAEPMEEPDQTITISTRNLCANDVDDYDFDWDPEENQIEELESPETFDEIFESLDFVTETLSEIDSGDECYDYMVEAVDTFRGYVEEGAAKEIISEDYFKDAFDEILSSYEEEDEENEFLMAKSSGGSIALRSIGNPKNSFGLR